MEHRKVDALTRELVPTEFVVSRVERASWVGGPEFGAIAIAYCIRQPLEGPQLAEARSMQQSSRPSVNASSRPTSTA